MVVLKKRSIEKFINDGDLSIEDKSSEKKWRRVIFRIPEDVLDKIDEKVKDHLGFSRTQWILSCISKELKECENEVQ